MPAVTSPKTGNRVVEHAMEISEVVDHDSRLSSPSLIEEAISLDEKMWDILTIFSPR